MATAIQFSWSTLFIGAAFFVAGMVKGATGMGLPTVAMGVLGSVMPPSAAAALLIIPSFVTNVWQLLAGPAFWHLVRRLGLMMLGILVSTVCMVPLLAKGNSLWATSALGVALFVYAAFTLFARQVSVPPGLQPWLSPVIGVVTGAVAGGTGVFVMPAVPYLQALGFAREDLIQALGLSFTVSTVALATGMSWHGAFQLDHVGMSVIAVIPALLGMWTGQALRQRIRPVTFRRWFLVCLLVLGGELALRPLF